MDSHGASMIPSAGNVDEGVPVNVWDGSLLQGRMQITTLWTTRKRGLESSEKQQERIRDVMAFLFYLEHEVGASQELKSERIKEALVLIEEKHKKNDHPFPAEITEKAVKLLRRFEAEGWGEELEVSGEDLEISGASNASSPTTVVQTPQPTAGYIATVEIRLPPPSHPIWGTNGIMHGLALKPGARGPTYIINPTYQNRKRDASVFGHNNLKVGAWFPLLRVAYFCGAHGQWVRGIHGDPRLGAYSIVVGGSKYESMDRDEGNVIWYSADNSVENIDRTRPAQLTGMARSLLRSVETKKPVRVLRKEKGMSGFSPEVGFRYDGLYRVVNSQQATNSKGGKYLRFKLVREQGQPPLHVIVNESPSPQQIAHYHRFRDGY